MSKNLTFKLIMDGDSKGLVAAAKQSETVTKKVFETIKTEAQKVQIDGLIEELNQATKEISGLGDKSVVSTSQIREMSMKSQQMVGALKSELVGAQAELVRLSQSKAAPAEITKATNLVAKLKASILSVEASFGAFESTAKDAMSGVDRAASKTIAEVQKFTSVDLTELVSEAQNASRAIESMGNGAVVSTKDVERMGQLGVTAINSLEQELLAAQNAFSDLSKSTDAVSLKEFNAATAKVNGLEDALSLAKRSFSQFESTANAASQNVANNANKLSTSAKKAGSDIYAALGIRPPTVINDAITDLSKKLENFKKNSKLPAEEIARVTKITEQEIARLKSELSGVETSANSANTGIAKLSKGMGAAKYAATALAGAMAALGVGVGIRELAQTADTYTNLSARINIATKEGGDFTSAMAGVHQVALMTNSSLSATGDLFTRLNAVGKDLGMTQQNSLDLTKTINQAIQISGVSAQASEAFTQQFIQSMQQGTLRGEEYNSMMENGYGVAEALAKGLGVTTGELKNMADNGELGAERVYKALLSQKDAVQQTFDQFPTTIGNALQRISTSWEILIGKMDQSNGTSATVADWLVTIADNMDIVETILKDIGDGFVWVGDQLKKIDPATIEALKTALSSAYETLKNAVATFGNGFQATIGQLDLILGSIFNFNSGVDEALDKTNGFTKFLQALNVALGFVSDGFSAIAIVANLLTGLFYDVASAWLNFKSKFTWGDTKQQIISEMNEMGVKAQEWYDKASNGATNFQSKGVAAIEEISKTQKQKNSESLAQSKATLDQLLAYQQAETNGKKASEAEKMSAFQAYAEAAIKANNGVMDGVMQADLLTKGYIVTIDEAGKVSVQAGVSAAQAAENAKVKEEALKVAKENVKKADEEYLAYQKQAAIERAALEQQIEQAKRTGDLNALASAQTSLAGIDTKEAELANNRTTRINELNQLNSGAGQVVEGAAVRARKAATALGIDLDIALGRVSEKFAADQVHLDNYANGFDELGLKGEQATNALYAGWEKWVAGAKSQVELDAAKAKLQSFGEQGKLSTSQVEMGLQAIKRASQELPASLSPAEAAMERLGIKSKEQLKLAAENALTDLDTVIKSGEATQEGLQKAYEETVRLAQASGNAQVMAAANAKAAYLGLEVQLDATGKATVSKLGEIQQAAVATQRSVSQVGQSSATSSTQPEVSPEQQATNDHWDDFKAKMKARTDAMNAKSQARGLGGGVGSLLSGSSQLAQQIPVAPEAPMIASSFDIKGIETMQPTEKKILEIQSGGKSAELQGTPEAVDGMEDILREFEMLKRSM